MHLAAISPVRGPIEAGRRAETRRTLLLRAGPTWVEAELSWRNALRVPAHAKLKGAA
jgi:hypothetical protein